MASKKVVPAKLPQPSSLDIVARNVEAVGITDENKKPVEKKPSPIKKVAALERRISAVENGAPRSLAEAP